MTNSYSLVELNALSLGWHIGFYRFFLAIAGNHDGEHLRAEDQQVLAVVRSRINELMKFFDSDIPIPYPQSPVEARSYFATMERHEESTSGSHIIDILSTHHGKQVAALYSYGLLLMTYALVAQRTEPALEPEIERLAVRIRSESPSLGISPALAEDIVSRPDLLANPAIVDRIVAARIPSRAPSGPSIRNPWATGSFYLASAVVVGTLFLVVARSVNAIVLPIIIIGSLLAVALVGALQLRNDARLTERSFLELMGLAIRSLPLLRRGAREPHANSDSRPSQ
jgi:hypothetical protein